MLENVGRSYHLKHKPESASKHGLTYMSAQSQPVAARPLQRRQGFMCSYHFLSPGPPKSAQDNGPISQDREYRQYRVHYFGHFGGPGSSRMLLLSPTSFAHAACARLYALRPCWQSTSLLQQKGGPSLSKLGSMKEALGSLQES